MIHHVFANKSNIGDLLSALGIQQLLSPLQLIEHLCDEPFVDQTLSALKHTSEHDLIVIGGGGLFMDYFAPFWTGLRDIRPRAKICLWGVGYCDLKAEPSHPPLDVVLDVIRASAISIVRDNLTRDYLGTEVVGPPVPCPSMVAVDQRPAGWGILHVDNYTTAGAAAFEAMDAVCRDFARSTGRPYRRTNNRIDREVDLERTLLLYGASDIIVSSALHGCIVAAAMGRRVCAVSGDRKIEAFMNAAGLSDWVLEVTALEQLREMLERVAIQRSITDFVEATRAANVSVAARVTQMASESTAG